MNQGYPSTAADFSAASRGTVRVMRSAGLSQVSVTPSLTNKPLLHAILALFAWCALSGGVEASSGDPQITVVFRYEYVANWTSTSFESKLFEAFSTRQLPLTVCVVPYERDATDGGSYYPAPTKVLPLTPEKTDLLKAAAAQPLFEVALLGYAHQERVPVRPYTELAGVPFVEQRTKISAGKRLLEQRSNKEVRTFVPPFNSYDDDTVRAVEGLGFRVFSAGAIRVPTVASELEFLPATCAITELKASIRNARESGDADPIIVVMFHPHDFIDLNDTSGRLAFGEFLELLDWMGRQPDVSASTIAQVAIEGNHDLSYSRYREYCARRPDLSNRFLPRALEGLGSDLLFYPSERLLDRTNLLVNLRIGVFYAGVALNAFLWMYLLLYRFPSFTLPAVWLGAPMAIALSAYALHDGRVYWLGTCVVASAWSGVLSAGMSAVFRARSRRETSEAPPQPPASQP